MTTERIDIVIREDGSRVVKRNLEDIAPSANKAATAVDYLKRTLGLLGGALAVREVLRLADTYTGLQNRLRSTGLEGETLAAVYDKLLAAANNTRSSVEGSIELYSRLALSSKELGVSQQQLIDFTTSLNQAINLSGASATEAQAGLIQLSQGMASGTLRGDELRSVLEQLPAVADVIAKSLGVTRGQLRKMGEDGKITAQSILVAFQKARGELEERFGKSVPTMGQAFQVLKNNVLDFVGRLDAATGASVAISKAVLFVANNVDTLADGMARLAGTLGTAAVAYGVFQAAVRANSLSNAVAAALAYREAIASGSVVLLGSATAERMKATAAAASAAVQTAAAASVTAAEATAAEAALASSIVTVNAKALQTTAARVAIESARETVIAQLAAAQADRASAIAAVAAAEAAGAQSFALAAKRTALAQLTVAEATHATLLTQLANLDRRRVGATIAQTEALAVQTAAQTALNEAQAASAVAGNAAAAAQARVAATGAAAATAQAAVGTSLLTQAFNALKNAAQVAWTYVARLFVLINTNPFIALATALTVIIGLLLTYGDQLDAGIDSMTTMRDVMSALGEVGRDVFSSIGGVVSDVFGTIRDVAVDSLSAITGVTSKAVGEWLSTYTSFYADVGSGFAGVVRAVAKTVDAIAGLITGMALAIKNTITGIPAIFAAVFGQAYNVVVGSVEGMINTVLEGVNKLRSAVGKEPLELVQLAKQDVDTKAFETYGANIATSITQGFEQQGGYMLNAVNGLFDRAAELRKNRERDALRATEGKYAPDLTKAGKPAKTPVDAKEVDKARNALRALLDQILPSAGAVLELAKAQKTLNDAQKFGLITAEQNARYYELAKRHYEDIINPLGKVNRELDEQAQLLRVTMRERDVETEVMRVQKDLRQQGLDMSAKETQALREKLQGLRDLNEIVRAQDQLLSDSVEKRREFATQLVAIQKLLADPTSGFTKADANKAVVATDPSAFEGTKSGVQADIDAAKARNAQIDQLRQADLISEQTAAQAKAAINLQLKDTLFQQNSTLFEGSQEAMDAQVQRFQAMYDQIQVLRNADVISEQTAAQARARVAVQQKQVELANTSAFFGQLANLQSSGNKKIAAIGKAAAITQATIDGVLAVQKALASFPPPYNYAMAAAVGISAAANVAKIAGFEKGGYTGNGGRSEVAGVVHGKEFVVNADGTREYRDVLERINAGLPLQFDAGTGAEKEYGRLMARLGASTSQPLTAPPPGYEAGGYVAPLGAPASAPGAMGGGTAAPAPTAAPGASQQGGITLVNVLDMAAVGEYLQGPDGEQVLINFMNRNGDAVRSIARG